jgi:hypothetical protein
VTRSGRSGGLITGLKVLIVRQRGHLIERSPINAPACILNSSLRQDVHLISSSLIKATHLMVPLP